MRARPAERAGRPFLYVAAGRTDKEKLAREVMERDGIQAGLICVLSCVEPCQSFSVHPNREKRELQLVARAAATALEWSSSRGLRSAIQ